MKQQSNSREREKEGEDEEEEEDEDEEDDDEEEEDQAAAKPTTSKNTFARRGPLGQSTKSDDYDSKLKQSVNTLMVGLYEHSLHSLSLSLSFFSFLAFSDYVRRLLF